MAEDRGIVWSLTEGRDAVAAAVRRPGADHRRASLRQLQAEGSGIAESLMQQYNTERGDVGLGTFLGVFVPCTCTIFGVVVFLRLGVVVGQAGIWCALLIVAVCFLICLLTMLSLCALISDGGDLAPLAPGGPRATSDPGVYCALRKAVGAELGAALGLAFYMAFTADVAFYIIGFAVTLRRASHLDSQTQVFGWNAPGTWVDVSIGSVALAVIALVVSRGIEFSARVSFGVLVAIVACICVSLACLCTPTYDPETGPTALSWDTFTRNAAPDLHTFNGAEASLTLMFVLVFPGFTGVLAGSNLSGNLRQPTRSIARGTLSSLVFVLCTYSAICLTLAATCERGKLRDNEAIMQTVVSHVTHFPFGQIGVGCTTLSSALSYLLGAPRVLQAVARDAEWKGARFWPLRALAAESDATSEPRRALLLTWLLAQLILLTGTVNLLAPLVAGLFLLAFCLINLVCFVATVSRSHFSPRFNLHSKWTCLLGFILSFMSMALALSSNPVGTSAVWVAFILLLCWQRRALMRLWTQGTQALHPSSRRLSSTAEERDELLMEERLERASVYVHDALHSRFRGVDWAVHSLIEPRIVAGCATRESTRNVPRCEARSEPRVPLQVAAHSRIQAQRVLRGLSWVRTANLGVYMLLAFFERPMWCYGKHGYDCGMSHRTKARH